MKSIDEWMQEYAVSHKNQTNKKIHYVCVPAIMFSVLGLVWNIPFLIDAPLYINWSTVICVLAGIFYLSLSWRAFLVMFLNMIVMTYGCHYIAQMGINLTILSVVIFIVAWVLQFIGHKIEGEKPSFFKDVQFLLIGPLWVYKNIPGVRY